MTWAKDLPLATSELVSFPRPSESWSAWKRRLAVGAIVVLVIVTVLFGASRYFRLDALDDYRTGYALGSVWNQSGEQVDKCRSAAETLYGDTSSSRAEPGWGEFLVGCADGIGGEQPVAWHGLRDRLWGTGGD